MDTIFHKLKKNDIKYQEYVMRGNGLFDEYKEFVTRESILAGKVRKNIRKPRSYTDFIIRLLYAYELYYDCFFKLDTFIKTPEMYVFNRKIGNFYSASLSAFYRFLLEYLETDYVDDRKLSINFLDEVELGTDSGKRPEKVFLNNRFIYPRNPRIAQEANGKLEVRYGCGSYNVYVRI